MKIIEREFYTGKIEPYVDSGLIKVLVGQRRVGKSCIMRQIADKLARNGNGVNCIYIDKEDFAFAEIRDAATLLDYVESRLRAKKRNYLFIDEVQEIAGFETALRSLHAKEQCDVFCTGSNAKMLSGELATGLSGRYVEFEIRSLDYLEFLKFHALEDSDAALTRYFTFGGLPHLAHLGLETSLADEYLKNLYSTILLKDVLGRMGLRNPAFLERLSVFLADNVGSVFSASSISRFLKSKSEKVAPSVIINYLHAMRSAFIVERAPRFDIRGKELFETREKYYFEDIGLRNALVGTNLARDVAKIAENAVFLHLRKLGYTVSVGEIGNAEVDFVAQKQGKTIYVQVAYLIADEKTRDREFGNLKKIDDNFPKYVVSMNPFNPGGNEDGILHLHIRDFLKKEAF